MSPYRGGPPPNPDEPPPDFRVTRPSARDKAFYCILGGAAAAGAAFVTLPWASAALFGSGLVAGAIAYATHGRRRGD